MRPSFMLHHHFYNIFQDLTFSSKHTYSHFSQFTTVLLNDYDIAFEPGNAASSVLLNLSAATNGRPNMYLNNNIKKSQAVSNYTSPAI
jgi:hypothetical protein